MSSAAPEKMLDPICDMIVVVADAKARGRTIEHDGRTYAFCSNGCVKAFNAEPVKRAATADEASAPAAVPTALP